MKSLFLDTNVIIDLIADRKPHSKFAIQLFAAAEKNKIRLYTSSHSIATTYYLLKKTTDEKSLRDILDNLMDLLHPIAVDLEILRRALKSNHPDFEDAIQIVTASTLMQLACIVTRNIKDFKHSDIPVVTPDKAILMI